MDVVKVWVPPREHLSVQALYDAAIALYWKISERQNSTHISLLKPQNTKTSLYKLSKNHWVMTLLENFGSVSRKLQSTVSLDHPVAAGDWNLLDLGFLDAVVSSGPGWSTDQNFLVVKIGR